MVICSQSLSCFFDIAALSSSVPYKTKLCRMLGLVGLAASTGMHFAGYQFREMPTLPKTTGEYKSAVTNVLAKARPADL